MVGQGDVTSSSVGCQGSSNHQLGLVPGDHGMPSLDGDRSRSSAVKAIVSKEPATFRPLAPREKLVEFIRNRRICCQFAFGISYNPEECSSVHDHISPHVPPVPPAPPVRMSQQPSRRAGPGAPLGATTPFRQQCFRLLFPSPRLQSLTLM